MPDGPVAAAIVLVVGLVLLGVGYLITAIRRPARSRRHHRDPERLPLFGTDQLAIRSADGTDQLLELDHEVEDAGSHPAIAHPRHDALPALSPPRSNGRHHEHEPEHVEPPLAPAAERRAAAERFPARITPPHPHDLDAGGLPAFATARGAARPATPSAGAPGIAPARPTRPVPAPQLAVTGYSPAFVDGETVRFAVPTDGTLQFLPGRLEIIAGSDTGREIRFVRSPGETDVEVTFGRSEGPAYRHVQLHARTVSRQHAKMSLIDAHWELHNLSTTNPVVLNGRVLAGGEVAPLLVDGDKIEMGEVVFLFHER